MRKIALSIILPACIMSSSLTAQESSSPCGTGMPSQQWEEEFQKSIRDYHVQAKAKNQSIYTIPVIFHVIHGGEVPGTFPNLAQEQINSQITVLNQDFSGTGFNAGNYPINAFVNWAIAEGLPAANVDGTGRVKIADIGVMFCLAEKDTFGNVMPEPGIDRINYISKGWGNPNTFSTTTVFNSYLNDTVKPQTIWNPKKYLNVWVSDRTSSLLFTGVATYPPLSGLTGIGGPGVGTDTTDGIWCYPKALGSYNVFPSGTFASAMVCGRTLTHEVGHYLGLRHIWGDGACATDYCNDTPPAAAQNVGSPTYPLNLGSCVSPSNSSDGEMFMNFMDYPSDPIKYMFTVDQAIRMQTSLINSPYRNQLGTHGLCSLSTDIQESESLNAISIYPNPASDMIQLRTNGILQQIRIFNSIGQLLIQSSKPEISIIDFPPGIYFITLVNDGKTDSTKIIKE